ncbi:MAG: hypothetical protein ABW106_06330 [Steroidobacteraceae bacterium]
MKVSHPKRHVAIDHGLVDLLNMDAFAREPTAEVVNHPDVVQALC